MAPFDALFYETINLDVESENLATKLCFALRGLAANCPDFNVTPLINDIVSLIKILDSKTALNKELLDCNDKLKAEMSYLESVIEDERDKRKSDFNESLCLQESIETEKHLLKNENLDLGSRLAELKHFSNFHY